VALGAQPVRHERLVWERVGAQVARPAASVAHKWSDSTAGPVSEPMVTSRQAPASALRPGLAAVSPLAAQALASAVTPVQLVASAAAATKQCAVLAARARRLGAAMAEAKLAGAKLAGAKLAGAKLAGAKLAGAKLAGAKLAGVGIPEVAMAGAKMLAARLAAPTAAKMLEARMAAPAATVPEWNLPGEVRRPGPFAARDRLPVCQSLPPSPLTSPHRRQGSTAPQTTLDVGGGNRQSSSARGLARHAPDAPPIGRCCRLE
jgi:hypothetical protein